MEGSIPYRVEYSTTNRAGCKGSAICKRDKVKIMKSELRFGTYVDTDMIQGWQWRHWGCVTSRVLKNVHDKTDGDYDLLDGLEDLLEEDQAKVKRALTQGEIDAADVSPQVHEEVKEREAKEAGKEAKKLQEEKEKENKKAEKEKEKQEKKAQKDEEKKAKKAEKEAAKAANAKKRKRDSPGSDTEEEDTAVKREKKVKQEDDDTPMPKSKAKKEVTKANSKKKVVKKETTDPEPAKKAKKVKKEENGASDPKQVKKAKVPKASDLDGATDDKPKKGRGTAKNPKKASAEPTRRSARTKR